MLRIIWGCVNANGTIHAGEGFSVQKVSSTAGTYDVVFDQKYAGPPAVTLAQNWRDWNQFTFAGGDTRDNCVLLALDESRARIRTGNNLGQHSDRNFSFIAVGLWAWPSGLLCEHEPCGGTPSGRRAQEPQPLPHSEPLPEPKSEPKRQRAKTAAKS